MNLFKRKKKNNAACCDTCSKDKDLTNLETSKKTDARIKVLGSGCNKCKQLEKATMEALSQLDIDLTVEHVTDFVEISSYGVMSTPALVVDEQVLSYGKVLKTDEIVKILQSVIDK